MEKREIKFRAWASDLGEKFMVYYNTPTSFDNGVWFGQDDNHTDEILHLMQFTGLKDKNGKEIYEGDIVMLSNKFTYTVSFEDGKFVCYHASQTNSMKGLKWGDLHRALDPDFSDYDFRVIGNIYENPELL